MATPSRLGGVVVALGLVAFPAPAAATIYYVESSGLDTNDGLTRTKAVKTIQAAVDRCNSGQDHIEVGAGSFTGFKIAGKAGIEVFGVGSVIDQPGTQTGTYGIQLSGVDTVTIRYFQIQNLPGAGVYVDAGTRSRHVKLLDLVLSNDGTGGSSNVIVNDTDDLVIGKVSSTGAGKSGAFLSNVVGALVQDCTFSNNPTDGIWVTRSSDVALERNTAHHNAYSGIELTGVANVRVRNCLVYRNDDTGISVGADSNGNASTGITLAGNTVFQEDPTGYCLALGDAPSVRVHDCILLHTGSAAGSISFESVPPLASDYNIFCNRFDAAGVSKDFGHWKSDIHLDGHSFTAGAGGLFLNEGQDKYSVKDKNAPSIDKGCGLFADTVDYAGAQRPQGVAYDIGCYEFAQVGPDAGMPDAAEPGPDATLPGLDASEPGLDAAPPGMDAGLDAAQPGLDAEQPGLDAGQPGPDAAQGLDAEQPALDAAQPGQDAAVADAGEPDGATAQADAEQPGEDGAVPGEDAALQEDAALGADAAAVPRDAAAVAPADGGEPSPVYDLGGCGCSSGGSGLGMMLLAIGALPLAARGSRRRR